MHFPPKTKPQVRTQLKMEGRSAMSLAAFYDHYLQCTAGFGKTYADEFTDIFSIADMISKLCKYVGTRGVLCVGADVWRL